MLVKIKDEMKFKRVIDTIRNSTGYCEGKIQEQTIELYVSKDEIIFKNLNLDMNIFQYFKIPVESQSIGLKYFLDIKALLSAIRFIKQGDDLQIKFLEHYAIFYINLNEYPILYNKPIVLNPPKIKYDGIFSIPFYTFKDVLRQTKMKQNNKIKFVVDKEREILRIQEVDDNYEYRDIFINTFEKVFYKNLSSREYKKIDVLFNVDNLKKATNLITFAGNNSLIFKIGKKKPLSVYVKNNEYEYATLIAPLVETEEKLGKIFI